MTETSPQAAGAACLALLRDLDRDRYLTCLLAPQEAQVPLAALYAFNAELARVRDIVREPLPGEIRLQYWRDLLTGQGHGESEANPVAAALMAAIRDHGLPVAPLLAMVDARVADLYDDPIGPRTALEGYAGETASALIQLASLVLDGGAASALATAAGHAGVGQAVAGLLLLMPQHRARGQVYVPEELLSATGFDRDSFLAAEPGKALDGLIDAFAGFGLDHLAKARAALPPTSGGRVPASLMPAYLPVALATPVLRRAKARGGAVLGLGLRPPQWRRQFTLLRAHIRRKF